MSEFNLRKAVFAALQKNNTDETINEYLDDIESFGDPSDYENLSAEEIQADFALWVDAIVNNAEREAGWDPNP